MKGRAQGARGLALMVGNCIPVDARIMPAQRAPVDRAYITQLVFAAVDEVNKLLRKSDRLDKSLDTIISGDGSQLDSLGLVNLIVAAEQEAEQRYGVLLTLAEDSFLGQEQNPFRTLGSLRDHIQALLESKLRD